MMIGSPEWQELIKKDTKNNPIILVYADGTVVTRHNVVTKGRICLKNGGLKRPILILYPECITDPVLLDVMRIGVEPVVGQCLMYKPPEYVGENNA